MGADPNTKVHQLISYSFINSLFRGSYICFCVLKSCWVCLFCSTKGRLVVLCLEHRQNSDTGSMTQRSSPIGSLAAEQLSGSSLCSSPDDNSCDGVKLEETEAWHLRLAFSTIWPGNVIAVCPYLDRYFLASAGNSVSDKIFMFANSHKKFL